VRKRRWLKKAGDLGDTSQPNNSPAQPIVTATGTSRETTDAPFRLAPNFVMRETPGKSVVTGGIADRSAGSDRSLRLESIDENKIRKQ